MKSARYIFIFIAFTCSLHINAQTWSYLYIQGDKETPFYVKLEGEMLPRYSKNYYIIPELAAGPVNLQILFQQNQYQPLHFKVLVPENGHRGFLLTKKDKAFALYDIQQRFYLMPGQNGEDHLPDIIPVKTPPANITDQVTTTPADEKSMIDQAFKAKKDDPAFMPDIVLENDHTAPSSTTTEQEVAEPEPTLIEQQTAVEEESPAAVEEQVTAPNSELQPEINTVQVTTQEQPTALESDQAATSVMTEPIQEVTTEPVRATDANVEAPVETANITQQEETQLADEVQNQEINNSPATSNSGTTVVAVPEPVYYPEPATVTDTQPRKKNVINSECPTPINENDFDKIYTSAKNKDDDEDLIKYLMKIAKTDCYTTQQVYFLSRELQAESMRYSFLKKVYPKVTDQYNFRTLEDHLFKTLEWKSYFRLIYQ